MEKFIGAKLRKAREALGLTQAAFARAVGLSSEYISLLEYSKRTPSFGVLQRIASYFNRDIAYFFCEKPSPSDAFTLLFRAEAVDDRARGELQKFRRYCDDYLRLEALTGRRLELAPLYAPDIPAERMADEERRRLGLGDEPIRDVFALLEANGCRILRLPLPEESKVSGVFIYLEQKAAAFALVNSLQSPGRQAFSAAHEYCHYLKDRNEGPVIDSSDVFIDEYAPLYHPREQHAQGFAARFLMPPAKVREIVEKDLRLYPPQRLTFEHALYLKRYFGVSTLAMLRRLRQMGYIGRTQLEEYVKIDPDAREKEIFGGASGGNGEKGAGAAGKGVKNMASAIGAIGGPAGWHGKFRRRPIPSDRFKLLRQEAARKIARGGGGGFKKKSVQKILPTMEL
jgi:transcriptional regulator with XRE-family HTH domain/Zn-dependent peptidase ImmA (M78 family)